MVKILVVQPTSAPEIIADDGADNDGADDALDAGPYIADA